MMEIYEHQKILVARCVDILRKYNICYLAAEERVGKSLAALYIANIMAYDKVLIITKKAAIKGWQETINASGLDLNVEVVNFERLRGKNAPEPKFDFFVIDEAHHSLSAYPKPSQTAKCIQRYAYEKPILFCSATPCSQSPAQLFHQLNISKYSPWDNYTSFYSWFKDFGILSEKRINGLLIKNYDKIKDKALDPIFQKYFVFMSRKDAGFNHHPEDVLHYVPLNEITKRRYAELEKTGCIAELNYKTTNAAHTLLALHQLEGGTLKDEDVRGGRAARLGSPGSVGVRYNLSDEKIAYILKEFGDVSENVIFYNYVAEGYKLRQIFRQTLILQGTTFAEGIDLSTYKNIIIYSMNFSVAKYIQRRARQCNKLREEEIKVSYILAKGCVSEALYQSVVEKNKNFTARLYNEFKSLRKC